VKHVQRGGRTPVRFRRSPHLVSYWHSNTLAIQNFATRRRSPATPLIFEVLDFCAEWRTEQQIESGVAAARSPRLGDLLARLVDLTFLHHSERPADARETAMHALRAWNPEAGFFHTATKDVKLVSQARAKSHGPRPIDLPMPATVKKYPGVSNVALPGPAVDPTLTHILLARRTSRRYSSSPVTLSELSSILGFAVGIQQWATTPSGEVALKTSPSGGARHSIECYVVARNIDGLAAGTYHYRPDRHFLERINGAVSLQRMRKYVPASEYFASASAMVFFSSVFTREIWRYPYARAYRATIAEAGHVCQTFLLVATSLGLASYCVMGLADSVIEADLGIDGITESVLYCAGIARMPKGKGPAILPKGSLQMRPNRYLRPLRNR